MIRMAKQIGSFNNFYVLVLKGHFQRYLNIFSTYSTNVEAMINPVSCTYPRVGVWSTSPEFYFFNDSKMTTNNDKRDVAEWTYTCDQNKKEKNWTHQLLPHENPTVAKKACLSCEQGRVEVDVFYLEISLEKFWRVWVEMSFLFFIVYSYRRLLSMVDICWNLPFHNMQGLRLCSSVQCPPWWTS